MLLPSGLSDFFRKCEADCAARGVHEQAARDARFMAAEVAAMGNQPAKVHKPAKPVPLGAERVLSGSQAKTAFALRMNAETMIEGAGLECIGFCTLTVGDYRACEDLTEVERERLPQSSRCGRGCEKRRHFVQVWCPDEASKRWNNLNRRLLPDIFEKGIVVTERHGSGAIHFHVLGVVVGRSDIRTGYNFTHGKRRSSASVALLAFWKVLRDRLPGYGFGVAELEPVKKCGKAVASYVSKYIEKNVKNRPVTDKGKKLVRYFGWEGRQLKPNGFSWGTPAACAWRRKTRAMAALIGIDEPEQAAAAIGPRWAFSITKLWVTGLGRDNKPNFDWVSPAPGDIKAQYYDREVMRAEMFRLATAWARRRDAEKLIFSDEAAEMRALMAEDWLVHKSDKGGSVKAERNYFTECGILPSNIRINRFSIPVENNSLCGNGRNDSVRA